MNEATTIFIIDCIFAYTDVLNEGNKEDMSRGNTPDLELSRELMGSLYIALFGGNISIHVVLLIIDQISVTKA